MPRVGESHLLLVRNVDGRPGEPGRELVRGGADISDGLGLDRLVLVRLLRELGHGLLVPEPVRASASVLRGGALLHRHVVEQVLDLRTWRAARQREETAFSCTWLAAWPASRQGAQTGHGTRRRLGSSRAFGAAGGDAGANSRPRGKRPRPPQLQQRRRALRRRARRPQPASQRPCRRPWSSCWRGVPPTGRFAALAAVPGRLRRQGCWLCFG